MSLTDELRDAGSPVRAYLDGVSPHLHSPFGGSGGTRSTTAETLGLMELASSTTLVPHHSGVDAKRSGTAFDFRTRIALGGFSARASAAADGVELLPALAEQVENGRHRAKILTEAFLVAEALLSEPKDEADLDRAAILLAHCEQIARAGAEVLRGTVGAACDLASDGNAFADGIDPLALTDMRSLREANIGQLELWQELIGSGERFESNPRFAGSGLVGGADADWLIGETLIDCKVYGRLRVPGLRGFLRQLLGYVMLDLDDALGIRTVGVWLPRQGLTPTWSLAHLLGGDPEELLPSLREGFAKAAGGKQVAIHALIPERRKRQLLAENRHTPHGMLSKLSLSDDISIRFRVGRNAATPEPAVRLLAGDHYARVREGVAMNEAAPHDVLEALAHDRSVVVRRAVAANPGAPRPAVRELESDSSLDVRWAARVNDRVTTLRGPAGADALEVAPQKGPARELVRIGQDRDDSALGSWWFSWMLEVLLTERPGRTLPVPEASRFWSQLAKRPLDIPDSLRAGLPEEVKTDLMRGDRPASVRRTVAESLPVSDPAVLGGLLGDPDAEIRWSALRRSLGHPHDALGGLLGELAADRAARLRFRTEGSSGPVRATPHTPSQYDIQMLEVIAAHPSTPHDALESLIESRSAEVLASLIENPSLGQEALAAVARKMQASRSVPSRELLARSSTLTEAASEKLATDRNPQVRLALAENHRVPLAALSRLAVDREPAVRLAVFENAGTPADLAATVAASLLAESADGDLHTVLVATSKRTEVELPRALVEDALDRLSKSRVRDPDMRMLAAGDERSGPKTLARLAKSADDDVRWEVAANPRTSADVLQVLAADPVDAVRSAAAGNGASDASVLAELARDEVPQVRAHAAGNPRLPAAALVPLLLDSERPVRTAAFENPSTPAEAAREAKAVWESRAPQLPRRTHADFMEMAANTRSEVRLWAAQDPDAPPDVLKFLGGERRSARVRRAVAAHPNTPPEVLWSLADGSDAEVCRIVAFNSASPADLLSDLSGRSVDLALLVAMNPDARSELLDALTVDSEPLVRFVANGARSARAVTGGGTAGQLPAVESPEVLRPGDH